MAVKSLTKKSISSVKKMKNRASNSELNDSLIDSGICLIQNILIQTLPLPLVSKLFQIQSCLTPLLATSVYLEIRDALILLIFDACYLLNYNGETAFLAVFYLDKCFAFTQETRETIVKVAMTCIFIAAKFGEELNEPAQADMEEVFALTDISTTFEEIKVVFD